ncbi:pyridoxamine 5'-phosphate oxidase family protein [Streptomyces sp. NPDC018031]|uniref:pyridoxamine 5'-phosphate oxidase family protein n=1 Tax=Streptomyces sp. NPDC018031 TaxID=3365033 RepID=UPI0037AAD7D5
MLIDARREPRALDLLSRTPYGRVSVSIGALPHSTATGHIVSDGGVLLRMHRGHGYHRACDGQVVAYGADTAGHPEQAPGGGTGAERDAETAGDGFWSVQCVGTARAATPTTAELNRFGPPPRTIDGEPFDPVYLRVQPKFVTVHHIAGTAPRQPEYAP